MITYLRSMIAVITGSILYIFMVWAPVIGPLITGFMVGLVSGDNARRGFFTGLFSGILGFSILIYIFFRLDINNFISIFLLWVLILWNLIGIAFIVLGSVMGAITFSPLRSIGFVMGRKKRNEPEMKTFIICRNCGSSNQESNEFCRVCGLLLR